MDVWASCEKNMNDYSSKVMAILAEEPWSYLH